MNDAEYNAFLQNLDDLAVCFLVCDMFVLINVLPPPEFLDTVFSAQVPLDVQIQLVDNLTFAFYNLQYVALNEGPEVAQRREVCQVLLIHFHRFLSS